MWIGAPGSANYNVTTGDVTEAGAYQTAWFTQQEYFNSPTPGTRDRPERGNPTMRGNVPGQVSRATSDYCCGASLAFERDCYGSEAQASFCYPNSTGDAAHMMNNAKDLIKEAFGWGKEFAFVDGCVGVEFPLKLPKPAAKATLLEAYTGMFGRIKASGVPISTFWLWTSENVEDHSTGKGYPQSNPLWAQLVGEIRIAQQAMKAVDANFSLGTNGWTVGPGDNASYFDKEITDPLFKIAAISGSLGWLPPDPAFGQMNGERAWVIPWYVGVGVGGRGGMGVQWQLLHMHMHSSRPALENRCWCLISSAGVHTRCWLPPLILVLATLCRMEDDLSLASAELWVNRTIHHGNLASEYNSTGLLGLMWRTWETSPQIKALAQSGWEVSGTGATPLTDVQLYTDFCTDNFGASTAARCAQLFLAVDGSAVGQGRAVGKLPRDGQACCGGPMHATPVPANQLLNVSGFENWLSDVTGPAYVERAMQWVNLFRYHRQTQVVANAAAMLNGALGGKIKNNLSAAVTIGVPLAKAITQEYTKMVTLLLEYSTTPGSLGMLGAHEGANWPTQFGFSDAAHEYPDPTNAPITRLAQILSGVLPPPGPPLPSCKPDLTQAECFFDNSTGTRCMPHTVAINLPGLTQELCASKCKVAGYSYAGVEFGVACFCDSNYPTSAKLPMAQCSAMKCTGDHEEDCGAADVLLAFPFTCQPVPPAPPPPHPHNYSRLIKTLLPNATYVGAPHMYQPAVRTLVSKEEAAVGVLLQATVLSTVPPAAVTLIVCSTNCHNDANQQQAGACTQHPMTVVADQKTGVQHSQVYQASVVAPAAGFDYSMSATFANGRRLRTPIEGNTTVTVL